jgi:hypothetical protein
MRRIALISSILLLAAACDKPGESPVMGTPLTDLSASPTVLFQVFGARTEPRAVPIAIVKDGTLSPITLDATGWRTLDSMVFTAGGRLSVYHRGADIGTALVVRGMWPLDGDALYTLPGCRTVVPQAALQLESNIALDESVEFLGSSQPLLQPAPTRPLPEDALGPGRAVAAAVATTAEIAPEELEHLDFYVDPDGGDAGPGAGHTSTVFVLAEDSAGTPITSYRHTGSGESRTVTFHRVVNHADLDGDGVAEILLESWRYAGVPDLVLLKYREGRWRETFRVSMEWCVDKGNDRR